MCCGGGPPTGTICGSQWSLHLMVESDCRMVPNKHKEATACLLPLSYMLCCLFPWCWSTDQRISALFDDIDACSNSAADDLECVSLSRRWVLGLSARQTRTLHHGFRSRGLVFAGQRFDGNYVWEPLIFKTTCFPRLTVPRCKASRDPPSRP